MNGDCFVWNQTCSPFPPPVSILTYTERLTKGTISVWPDLPRAAATRPPCSKSRHDRPERQKQQLLQRSASVRPSLAQILSCYGRAASSSSACLTASDVLLNDFTQQGAGSVANTSFPPGFHSFYYECARNITIFPSNF